MYFLLGVSLSLAFLLAVNLLVSVLASAIWSFAGPQMHSFSVGLRAQIIFGLRILPIVAAIIFVCAFVIPAYVMYEPSSSGEVVSRKLALIALTSSLAVTFAFFMVFRTWLATRRLMANWLNGSSKLQNAAWTVPIYKIDHAFPVVAVVGILRPRLFVAKKVVESLSDREFAAAVAHEYGHLSSRDNLKRTILRVCRDMLVIPIGKGLDRSWSECVESVADQYAARSCRGSSPLDLASALIKIAKLVPAGTIPAMPVGASLIAGEHGEIGARVQELVSLSQVGSPVDPIGPNATSVTFWIWSLIIVILAVLPFTDTRIWSTVHLASERLVHVLQ